MTALRPPPLMSLASHAAEDSRQRQCSVSELAPLLQNDDSGG